MAMRRTRKLQTIHEFVLLSSATHRLRFRPCSRAYKGPGPRPGVIEAALVQLGKNAIPAFAANH